MATAGQITEQGLALLRARIGIPEPHTAPPRYLRPDTDARPGPSALPLMGDAWEAAMAAPDETPLEAASAAGLAASLGISQGRTIPCLETEARLSARIGRAVGRAFGYWTIRQSGIETDRIVRTLQIPRSWCIGESIPT